MKKSLINIAGITVFLPVFFALSGLSVIRHECSLCGHSDIDIFTTEECCNESHDISECCHEEKGLREELHKCRHTVYMFSVPTTLSAPDFNLFAESDFVTNVFSSYLIPVVSKRINVEKLYPPPAYISNCVLRT